MSTARNPKLVYTAPQVDRMLAQQKRQEISFLVQLSRCARSDAKAARKSRLEKVQAKTYAHALVALRLAEAACSVAMRSGTDASRKEARSVRDLARKLLDEIQEAA